MKIKLILIASILLISCSPKQKTETNEGIEELIETPEILNDNKTNSSYFLSKRYHENIIEELFNEALENNQKLNDLNKKIRKILSDSIQEKTKEYLVYKKNNTEYWNTAKSYINNLNDSIGKIELLKTFNKLEKNYERKVTNHESKMDSITSLKLYLSDQENLIKLLITQKMIDNYQINELPKIDKLESMIKDLKKIIEESKEYSTIEK